MGTHFNNLISSTTCNKSSSEQMAAKALTELSTFSKPDSILNESSKSIMSSKTHISVGDVLRSEEKTNHNEEQSFQSQIKETELADDVSNLKKGQCFQQRLETAAVLMDISKKVIISPPCSNPQSPKLCSSLDSSILNSVIKDRRPVNVNLDLNKDFAIKGSKCDLRSLFDFYSHHDKLMPTNEVFSEAPISKEMRLQNKVNTNALNIIVNSNAPQRNAFPFPSNKIDSIETGSRCEPKTPDSQTSEEQGTDAATTQLWQALARSTGNKFLRFT